jgi:nitrate reductase NapE component
VGRQACDVLLWVSFLLFPCLPVVVVGVAGWNMETGKVFCAPFFCGGCGGSARCWVLRRHRVVVAGGFLVWLLPAWAV